MMKFRSRLWRSTRCVLFPVHPAKRHEGRWTHLRMQRTAEQPLFYIRSFRSPQVLAWSYFLTEQHFPQRCCPPVRRICLTDYLGRPSQTWPSRSYSARTPPLPLPMGDRQANMMSVVSQNLCRTIICVVSSRNSFCYLTIIVRKQVLCGRICDFIYLYIYFNKHAVESGQDSALLSPSFI